MASAIIETIQACGVLCELRTPPIAPEPTPAKCPVPSQECPIQSRACPIQWEECPIQSRVPHPSAFFAEGGFGPTKSSIPSGASPAAGVPQLPLTIYGERPNTKRVGELAEAAFLHKAEILA